MAANKESIVMIVDVGVGAENLTKAAADCSLKVIKNKIFNNKIDMLAFLLLRTKETENVGNTEEPDQYLNISQVLSGSQIPTWYMAKEFLSSLEKEKCKRGDWVDALIVAFGIITEDAALHKTKMSKIVLFHNFDSPLSSLDDAIVAKLNEINSQLIIVSDNIHYISDSKGKLQPQFKTMIGKSVSQTKNEELAMELRKLYPPTIFCNFNDALPIILRKNLRHPWSWNCTFSIGSRIVINCSGVIAIKEETTVPKFQKRSKGENETVIRDKKYYSGVDELSGNAEHDLISGYMLGNTPMPYDASLGQAPQADTKKGVYFTGFVPAQNIPQEHFTGSSTYVLFPQKGKRVSARKMDSLVRAMSLTDSNILAWKVYNNGHKPKLVVLIPNLEYNQAGLSMIELSYHSQHRFWDFPRLITKKNQPSSEQLEAVDELMASMELSPKCNAEDDKQPVNSINKDYLPFEFLPNINQRHLIDFLTKNILKQAGDPSTDQLLKVPNVLQPQASAAAEKVKQVFSLKKKEVPTKEKLKKHLHNNGNEDNQSLKATTSTSNIKDEFKISHVGTVTPAEDFTALISHIMNNMPNGAERAAKFHQYTCQMRTVISDLLFKSMIKQNEKIQKALVAYRKLTIAADSPYDYNDWMREIRMKVIERKMVDFWEEVVVKGKLGLCMEDETEVVEKFYDISKELAAADNLNTNIEDDGDVDDLFGNM